MFVLLVPWVQPPSTTAWLVPSPTLCPPRGSPACYPTAHRSFHPGLLPLFSSVMWGKHSPPTLPSLTLPP